MALTEEFYTGDGSRVLFPFAFEYLQQSDVKVSLDSVATTAYSFANATTIEMDSPPAVGVSVRVYRDTDTTNKAEFVPGSSIRAQDLNNNFDLALFRVEEGVERSLRTDGSGTMSGDLDMGGFEILNVAPPTSDGSAVNKQYVDNRTGNLDIPGFTRWRYNATGGETTLSGVGSTGSTLGYSATREQVFLNGAQLQRGVDYTADNGTSITLPVALLAGDVVEVHCVNSVGTTNQASDQVFIQAGSGAIARSVESKLREFVSVKDFGAVGDGVADDAPAFTNALAASQNVKVPKGTYKLNSSVTVPVNYTLETDYGVTFTGSGSITGSGVIRDYGVGGLGPQRTFNLPEQRLTTTDSDAVTKFDVCRFRVATEGNTNSIVGAVVQTGPANGYPCGLTGYGKLNHDGNQAFGVFGRADANSFGVATNEFNTFNNKANPPVVFPPNRAFGITDTIPVTITCAAAGTYQSLIGLHICQEGSEPNNYVCGIYTNADAVTNYGVFIDSTASEGPNVGVSIKSKHTSNTSVNLELQSKNPSPHASADFIRCFDSGGLLKFAVRPTGLMRFGSGIDQATVGIPGAASVLPSNPTGYLRVEIAGSTKVIPFYES